MDRCMCFDVTFESLVEGGCKTLEDAALRWGCGTKCGLCKPYIERTLATGEVRHRVIPTSDTM